MLSTNGLLAAGAALSAAIAPAVHAIVLDDSVVGFLALLVLLLALALIAIVRFEPPERAPIAEETAQAAMPAHAPRLAQRARRRYRGAPGLPTAVGAAPRARHRGQRPVAQTPLPVRPSDSRLATRPGTRPVRHAVRARPNDPGSRAARRGVQHPGRLGWTRSCVRQSERPAAQPLASGCLQLSPSQPGPSQLSRWPLPRDSRGQSASVDDRARAFAHCQRAWIRKIAMASLSRPAV